MGYFGPQCEDIGAYEYVKVRSAINAPRRWTPTLEMDTNTKIVKGPWMTGQTDGQTDGWTDILYCHSGDLILWPAVACATHNYGTRAFIANNWRKRRDRYRKK